MLASLCICVISGNNDELQYRQLQSLTEHITVELFDEVSGRQQLTSSRYLTYTLYNLSLSLSLICHLS